MSETELEQRLRELRVMDMPPSSTARPIDTASAWRELQALRTRSVAHRRRVLTAAAAAVVAVVVIAVPLLSGTHHHTRATQPGTGIPGMPKTYPSAVVGRIPFGGVESVVGDAAHAWVIRVFGPPVMPAVYRLTGIDLRDNSVMFSTSLGHDQPSIANGDGRLWVTTPYGQGRGQIERLDLATGQVLSTIHLGGGRCEQIAYGSGQLFAACASANSDATDLWQINPVTERARRLAGPMHGRIFSLTAAPGALWFTRVPGVIGLVTTDSRPHVILLEKAFQYYVGELSVVYGDGSVWLLRSGERLASIDPRTGQVQRRFTYRNFDPRRAGGLDFVTAGDRWLWFLDNGYPFSGVLRVSESTGRPDGGVRIPPASCGQRVCSQIFHTPGNVWVPTAGLLIRISTSRLAG